jgi:hypothetical protein
MDYTTVKRNETFNQKMRANYRSKFGKRHRLFIPVSGFSFATFPVRVNPAFRCAAAAANSKNKWRDLPQSAFINFTHEKFQ